MSAGAIDARSAFVAVFEFRSILRTQVGLPGFLPAVLRPLESPTDHFCKMLEVLAGNLQAIRSDWQSLNDRDESRIGAIHRGLHDRAAETSGLISSATELRLLADNVRGEIRQRLDFNLKMVEQQRQRTQISLPPFEELLQPPWRQELAELAHRWSGIARALWQKGDQSDDAQQVHQLAAAFQHLSHLISEVSNSYGVLARLSALDKALVGYSNSLIDASAAIDDAKQNQSAVLGARTDGLAAYYRRRAAADMDRLFAWIDTLEVARSVAPVSGP